MLCYCMLRRTVLLRAAAAGARSGTGHPVIQEVAQRIPATGLTGPQLQALVEDSFPLFEPAQVGAATLREVIEAFPDTFRVEEISGDKWVVKPRGSDPVGSVAAHHGDPAGTYREVLRYCTEVAANQRSGGETPFIALEDILARMGIKDGDVVDTILDNPASGLEVKVSVGIRPKRPARAAFIFVDGDELQAVAIDKMCTQLNLIKEECRMSIVRRAGSAPISTVDTLTPDIVPTYLSVERKVRELRYRDPGVRRDIIFMCSTRLFRTYAEHVALVNSFPDADVYVCSPGRVELVKPKQVVAFL